MTTLNKKNNYRQMYHDLVASTNAEIAELKKHKEWNNVKVNGIEVTKIKADAIREMLYKMPIFWSFRDVTIWLEEYADNLEKDDV